MLAWILLSIIFLSDVWPRIRTKDRSISYQYEDTTKIHVAFQQKIYIHVARF